MQDGPNRGLVGKARRTRYRSRASCLHAQQMIAEYFDPKPDPCLAHRERLIPIGHRREFLPSAAPTYEDGMGNQLELPLTHVESIVDGAIRVAPIRKATAATASGRSKNGKAVRQPGHRIVPGSAPGEPESSQPFTLRGFLCGCAVGGAAAAMVLLLLQAVSG